MQVNHSYEFKTAEEAWDYAVNKKHRAACMYNYSKEKLSIEIKKIYDKIKEVNRNITDIEKQLWPTYPHWYREIDGCLGVYGVEITIDTVENWNCIAICPGRDESVLNIHNTKKYER